MTGDAPPKKPPSGANKRAFNRIPVQLGARAHLADGRELACTIRDFSSGGMLLFYQDAGDGSRCVPVTNSEVKVVCRVKSGDVKVLHFSGTVARHSESGFALRLASADLPSLQLLQKVAVVQERRALEAAAQQQSTRQEKNQLNRADLVRRSDQLVLDDLEPMVNEFLGTVLQKLVDPAVYMQAQNRNVFMEASGVLTANREALRLGFVRAAGEQLRDWRPQGEQAQEFTELGYSADTLSLVNDDAYEEWLADTTTTDKVENEYAELLYEIGVRLSELHQVKIDNKNNPYRPALFVDSLEQMVRPLGFTHAVNMLCFTVFREVLLRRIGDIYRRLNQFLIAQGVIPVITYHINKQTGERTAVIPAEAAPPQPTPPVAPPAAVPKKPVKAAAAPTAVKAAPVPASVSAVVAEPPPSILDIVGNLRSLAAGYGQPPVVGGKSAPDPDAGKPDYSVHDILDALAALPPPAATGPALSKQDLLQALQRAAGPGKKLGRRETQIIDVSDKVFQLMNTDEQVSGQIKSWINRLEVPILKIALRDESLFLDREHIVRQVINKIAKLEVLVGEAEKASPHNSMVVNAIEWLIDMVNKEHEVSADVFARAAHQLDILLRTQQQTYDKNLEQVRKDITAGKTRLAAAGNADYTDVWQVPEEIQDEWRKKVGRLREQDWLLLHAADATPERLRVGVVDQQGERLALVNQTGKLNKGVSFNDMARHLYDGSATYVQGSGDQAMDRAQYSMLQELHEELLDQALHDPLTGLYNRREFTAQLAGILGDEANAGDPRCTIAFFDVDQFKLINSACGYQAGDELLRRLTAIMREKLPADAILARVGSDEFGMILRHLPLDDVLEQGEALLATVHGAKFNFEDKRFTIGLSGGVVHVRKPGAVADEILQEAENNCAMAKNAGGNRIMVYAAGNRLLSHQQDMLKWAAEIDHILENDLLTLSAQRIMPIRGGGMRKDIYEVLLRVKNTKGENITEQFVEAAEHYRRMQEVDRWVVSHAFEWMRSQPQKLARIEALTINLSGNSLNDETFLQFIRDELQGGGGVPASKICFEITETTGITSLSNASEFMLTLKDSGCRFSLDDFGAGMSSYAYLKNLPVDFLKIDGAFVRDLLRNASDQAVVNSICEVGHFMGKKVIAEYVESGTVLKKLQDLRVDYAQGYAVEKPKALTTL